VLAFRLGRSAPLGYAGSMIHKTHDVGRYPARMPDQRDTRASMSARRTAEPATQLHARGKYGVAVLLKQHAAPAMLAGDVGDGATERHAPKGNSGGLWIAGGYSAALI